MSTPQLEPPVGISASEGEAHRSSAPDPHPTARAGRAGVVAGARSGFSATRRGVVGLAARLPATARATRTAALGTVGALQTLPDPTLRSLAASAVGLGVGLSFTRARRVAFVVGMVPALLIQAAIAVRPLEKHAPADARG